MQALCKPHGEEVRFAPKPVPWGWALQEPSRTQQNPADVFWSWPCITNNSCKVCSPQHAEGSRQIKVCTTRCWGRWYLNRIFV